MKIRVTKRDIAYGVRGESGSCPVAMAIRRRVSRDKSITVGIREIHIMTFGKYGVSSVTYSMDRHIQDFVKAFDKGEPVQPTSFDMDGNP